MKIPKIIHISAIIIVSIFGLKKFAQSYATPETSSSFYSKKKKPTKSKNNSLTSNQKYTIFWDIGGVLLSSNKFHIVKNHIGLTNIGLYSLHRILHKLGLKNKKLSWNIIKRLFKFIEYIDNCPNKNFKTKATMSGSPLPRLVCEWQKGKISSEYLVNLVLNNINNYPEFFTNEAEKNLFRDSIPMFLPQNYVDFHKSNSKTINLLYRCARNLDQPMVILSNWDKDSFQILKSKHPRIFSLFDPERILASGEIGYMKPDKSLFKYLKSKYKLKPENCILIDDHPENISEAQKYGWKGILHTSPTNTAHELGLLGIKLNH